jgi:hypothetical protein
VQGIQGVPGTQGEGFNFRDEWNPAVTYIESDVVTFEGSTYRANTTTSGVVTDTFTRADGPSILNGWTNSVGTHGVISGQAYPIDTSNIGGGSEWSVATRDTGDPNFDISLVVSANAGTHGGVIARFSGGPGAANLYYFRASGHMLRYNGASSSQIGVGYTAFALGDVMRVVGVGDTFSIYKNGSLIATRTDSNAGTDANTRHGFGSNNDASVRYETVAMVIDTSPSVDTWDPLALKGAAGPQGPAGADGGSLTDAYRGAWAVGTAYEIDDLVLELGTVFLAVAASTGESPSHGGPVAVLGANNMAGGSGFGDKTATLFTVNDTCVIDSVDVYQTVSSTSGKAVGISANFAPGAFPGFLGSGVTTVGHGGTWQTVTLNTQVTLVPGTNYRLVSYEENSVVADVAPVLTGVIATVGGLLFGPSLADASYEAAGLHYRAKFRLNGAGGPGPSWEVFVPAGAPGAAGPPGADGTGGGGSGVTARGEWNDITTYVAGDAVLRFNRTYLANNENINVDPGVPGAQQVLGANDVTQNQQFSTPISVAFTLSEDTEIDAIEIHSNSGGFVGGKLVGIADNHLAGAAIVWKGKGTSVVGVTNTWQKITLDTPAMLIAGTTYRIVTYEPYAGIRTDGGGGTPTGVMATMGISGTSALFYGTNLENTLGSNYSLLVRLYGPGPSPWDRLTESFYARGDWDAALNYNKDDLVIADGSAWRALGHVSPASVPVGGNVYNLTAGNLLAAPCQQQFTVSISVDVTHVSMRYAPNWGSTLSGQKMGIASTFTGPTVPWLSYGTFTGAEPLVGFIELELADPVHLEPGTTYSFVVDSGQGVQDAASAPGVVSGFVNAVVGQLLYGSSYNTTWANTFAFRLKAALSFIPGSDWALFAPGVPPRGSSGQVLAKSSNITGDIDWRDALLVVQHGSDPAVARPDAVAVYWIGSVEPDNMTDADLWNGPA